MTDDQSAFLHDEFHSLTLNAVVQRGKVYEPGLAQEQRSPFHRSLRSVLDRLAPTYQYAITEEEHVRNIEHLSEELSAKHAGVLLGARFRIGSTQKALNLYLKYLWCVGEIPAPPHCPFDRWVIDLLPGYRDVCWTKLDDIETYKRLVQAARTQASGLSLPVWELRIYNGTSDAVQWDRGE